MVVTITENVGLAKKFTQVFHKMLQKHPNKLFGQLNMKHSVWPRVISPSNSSKASLLIPPLPPQNAAPITTSLRLLWEGSWCTVASPTECWGRCLLSGRSGRESRSMNNNPDFPTPRLEDTGAHSNSCSVDSPWKWNIWVSSTPHTHCLNTPNITSCRNQHQRNLFPSCFFGGGCRERRGGKLKN